MPRWSSNKKGLAVAALILFSLFLAFALLIIPAVRSTVTFTTLSLSQVDVISNDQTLNGKAFLYTGSANQNSESAQGKWTPSSAGQAKDFTITYEQQEQYCKYPIVKNTGSPVYQAWYLEEGADTQHFADANAWCRSLTGTSTNTWAGSFCASNVLGVCTSTKWWCTGLKQIGVTGTFQDIAFNWKGKITVTSQSGTTSGVLGGLGEQNSIVLPGSDNNPAVWVKWAGNLVSGTDCAGANPTTNIMPAYNSQTQHWNIGNQQALTTYQYYFNALNTCLYSKGSADSQGRQNCFAEMNAYANSVINNWNSIGNWQIAAVDESNVATPFVRINTGLIQYPVLQFKIKADWVGIYAPCGSPSITQYDGSITGTATNSYQGTTTVKNTGGSDSAMGASFTCPSGVSVSSVDAFIAPAGQSRQVTYQVTSSQAVSGQCTICVYDKNCPNNKECKPFWVEFKRYCAISCNGNFVLDGTNCVCVCPLKSRSGYTIDATNCAYVAIPQGQPGSQPQSCSLTCPNKYAPNTACNGCDCALDPSKVPEGYTFNATSCEYQVKPTQPPTAIDINIILGGVAVIAIIVGAYLWLRRGKRGGRHG